MAKGLKQRDLLYVSNANGTVSVYRYWQRTLVGVLTHFKKPMGECANPKTGNVYITDYNAEKIYEYAHGGKTPVRALDDAPYMPYACSVAPANGDLAVANDPYEYYHGKGNIAIYPHGSGTPKIVEGTGSSGQHFTACAYDDRGDLLAMSQYKYSPFWYDSFYYLPKGGSRLLPISLPNIGYSSHFGVVQGVAWDGKYWVAGPIYGGLFLYTINIKAYYVGSITLAKGTVGPIWVYRKSLAARGTQVVAGVGSGTLEYWAYPAGGNPIGQISKDLDNPFGVAVSLGAQ
jgi:hypothetical protein